MLCRLMGQWFDRRDRSLNEIADLEDRSRATLLVRAREVLDRSVKARRADGATIAIEIEPEERERLARAGLLGQR